MGRRLQRWSRFNYARPVITLPPSLGEERKKLGKFRSIENPIYSAHPERILIVAKMEGGKGETRRLAEPVSQRVPLSLSPSTLWQN